MSSSVILKINFRGGIISPGDLFNILVAAGRCGVTEVKFGLRQQMLIELSVVSALKLSESLNELGIQYETSVDRFPNIVSSYPAEEIFINQTWLSEGVYKDIFDSFDYRPAVKINISDSNQSFTPLLTGNINWVASIQIPHYWHCFIRLPKTNSIYECNTLVYSNDIAMMSKNLEALMKEHSGSISSKKEHDIKALFDGILSGSVLSKESPGAAILPPFNLPYYEGLNRYNNNKYWLGIYRRDEMYPVDFLKAICKACLDTKIGQLCSTPWKSIIIKSIEPNHRTLWNTILARFHVNVRHAANELNFQVEDHCVEGLSLKHYLVKYLNDTDTRTFGICIGIKTRKKSEVFSSILIRRRSLFTIGDKGFFNTYDILCAEEFNPNKRTAFVFSRNNPKLLLQEQLRRAILSYYKTPVIEQQVKPVAGSKALKTEVVMTGVWYCTSCFTVYNEQIGDEVAGIKPGTSFKDLPYNYCCAVCDEPKSGFKKQVLKKISESI